VFG
jgi:tyrosine-protein phosphatase non-receptor type 23